MPEWQAQAASSFNSATARSRGETAVAGELTPEELGPSIRPRHGAVEKRGNQTGSCPQSRFLQFGHGTEPWRNQKQSLAQAKGLALQFGHGTEPWRNTGGAIRKCVLGVTFNSATARSRGETSSGHEIDGSHSRPSIRPRHGAVEKHRVRTEGQLRGFSPSIRPRHGAVEKRLSGPPA